MELKNKTAVITGISKGIGKATAQLLLSKGCNVAGLGMTPPDYAHENLLFIPCDIRQLLQVEQAFDTIRNTWGDDVHILVNNAGLGYFGCLENITPEQWDELFDTNVKGMFYCTKQVLPQMKQQQYGHSINIAATAALERMPQGVAYC